MFWEDRWLEGESIADLAPYLNQVVPRRIRGSQSVREGLTNRGWVRSITRALSTTAIAEYLELWDRMNDVQLTNQADRTIWFWSLDGIYTAKSAYTMLHAGSTTLQGHTLIWKTWDQLRVKIFLWLAFRRWHWTADSRRRHGLEARDTCYLDDQEQNQLITSEQPAHSPGNCGTASSKLSVGRCPMHNLQLEDGGVIYARWLGWRTP